MTPEERYEALALASAQVMEEVADRVMASGVEVQVMSGPEAVTVPVRLSVPGTSATTAVIGQAALTLCAVRVGGVRGDAARPGRDLRGALAAAICDAEAERNGILAAEVTALAERALVTRTEMWRHRARTVALTRLQRA